MAENREEILANFQGITAIEDVAEAIYHLEEANWDLLSAINRVMPQDADTPALTNETHDVEMIDEDISVITPKTHPPDRVSIDSNQASTSTHRNNTTDLVELQVHCNNKIHEIKMSGAATVGDLKKRLEAVCGVPVCRQQISGLGGSRATSSATLASLNLTRNAMLRLKPADELMADDEVAERLTTTYVLRIKHDEREYTLKFPGTRTVREVKNDIYSLTDIPVRHQVWTGWPNVTGLDDTVLAMVGLDLPQHDLTVKRAPNNKHKDFKRIIVDNSSDSENSSVEEIEDSADGFTAEDDNMFVDLVQSERLQPLMSDHVEDEALGCIEFSQRFRSRYGPNTPNFFEGTLQDAIKEACLKPAKERKLLGVYLHHEQSVLSNVFCAQLLGCDTVLQTLQENFIVYGWDLTHPDNNNMLLNSVANALGPVAAMTIRSIPVERLPALVIIMRVRSNTEIYSVINGVSELVGGLVEALERFASQRSEDARVERERDARQKVKREQDEAYQRSLEADRAKEEIKKQQELERNQEIERVESERQMEEARKAAARAAALARVPLEPGEGAAEVARIRVRAPPPHPTPIERRFHADDTLAALLDFLASKGFPPENYKVISSWPRRDLTAESPSSTLRALKLYPQETLMLEER